MSSLSIIVTDVPGKPTPIRVAVTKISGRTRGIVGFKIGDEDALVLVIFEDPMIVVGFKFVDGDAFLLSFFGDPTIIIGTMGWAMSFFNLKLGSYLIFSNGWGSFINLDIS
jgi:hypothetical protein